MNSPNFNNKAGGQTSAFVLFRFPEEENLQFWQGKITENPDTNSYFIFSPFCTQEHTPKLFLEEKNCHIQTFTLEDSIFKIDFLNNFFSDFFSNLKFDLFKDFSNNDFSTYQKKFKDIQRDLVENNISKIVLSHRLFFPNILDVFKSFEQLLKNFNNTLVYLFYSPISGLWMGASPELLLEKDNNLLKTTALAGTKNVTEIWTEKEKKEQFFVTDFIEGILKKNQLKNYQKTEPYTFSYGVLNHLKTDFTVEIPENFNEMEFLQALHPTPAVCGIPQYTTYDFLKNNEKYRDYYTGFLGQINSEKSKIFVNLRCAKIEKNHFYLYAGGGVTLESELKKEWQEIQNKLKNLEKHLVYA